MNIFDNKKVLGHIKDTDFIGEVITINLVTKKVLLDDDDEQKVVEISDVEFLKEVFVIHDTIIFDKDVLIEDKFSRKYLVNLHDDGKVSLDELNNNLEIIQEGTKCEVAYITSMLENSTFSLLDNLYKLRLKLRREPDFNINIVKDFNGKHYTYYYALNNKEEKVIDLIKVNTLIGDEEHKRITLSYEGYAKVIEDGIYRKVSDREFDNYLAGFTYGQDNSEEVFITCGVNCGCNLFCEQKNKSEQEESNESNKSDESNKLNETVSSDYNETVNSDDNKCKSCSCNLDKCYCSLWD